MAKSDVKINIDVGGNVEKALPEINKDVNELSKSTEGLNESFVSGQLQSTKLGGALSALSANPLLAVTAGVTALATGVVALSVSVSKNVDEVNKLSNAYGVSVQDLSSYKLLADQNKTSLDAIANSMKQLTMDLSSGGKKLEELGVATKNANGETKDLNTLFIETVDRLSKIENETDRAQASFAIFGRQSEELAGIIQGGAQGIEEYREEAEALGIVISDELAQDSAELQDALGKLDLSFEGFKNAIVKDVIPVVTTLASWLTKLSTLYRSLKVDFSEIDAELIDLSMYLEDSSENTKKFTEETEKSEKEIRATSQALAKYNKELQDLANNQNKIFAEEGLFGLEGENLELTKLEQWFDSQLDRYEEYQVDTENLTEEYERRRADIIDKYREQERQKELEDYQAKVALQEELAELERQEAEKRRFLREQEIEDERLKNEQEIQIMHSKLDASRGTFEALKGLSATFAKENKAFRVAERVAAIGESTVNTAVAVSQALRSSPYPFNIANAIAVGAFGAVQTGVIASQRFETGGVVDSAFSTGDQSLIRVNGGERVLTSAQWSQLDSLVFGGGFGAQGGSNGRNTTINISGNIGVDEEAIAQLVVNGLNTAEKSNTTTSMALV